MRNVRCQLLMAVHISLLSLTTCLMAWGATGSASVLVEQWDTHEMSVKSRTSYANPFRDVQLTATFTHQAGGKGITVEGFYDGDQTWRVRFLPTQLGGWRYATHSADPELNDKSGTVICGRAAKPYLHGPLRADGSHFVHADGTRRFLISTRLSCQFASPEVRHEVVRFLKESSINRVLFIIGGIDRTVKELYGPDVDFWRYDVRRFQAVDTFIDELRRADILASPYFYYFNDKTQRRLTIEQDRAFIRYGMARFGAYANVMPVLSNQVEGKHTDGLDAHYNLRSHVWANEIGPFMKQCTVFGQPVTVHNPLETDRAVSPGFYALLRDWPFPWADFMLRQVQVGALGAPAEISDNVPESQNATYNHRAFARHNELLIGLRRFGIPVINEEPGYELGGGDQDGKGEARPWNSQTSESLLATFWTATASGGYTMWGSPATYVLDDPRPKLLRGSSTPKYLEVLYEIMSGLPYWEMAPMNDLVNADAVTFDGVPYRRNFALAKPGFCYLVYSRHGGVVEVALDEGNYVALRVDPRTGAVTRLGTTGGGKYSAELPTGSDSVLILKDEGKTKRLFGKQSGEAPDG